MRKSASNSKPRKPDSLKRTRALARGGIKFEPVEDAHMKFIWAAYRHGVFDEGHPFEEGLEPMDFALKFAAMANDLMAAGTSMITVSAETPKGNMPVALITLDGNERVAWPKAFWFPSASPRNKVEIGVKFFRDMKKTHLGLVTARPKDQPYYRHLAKYGLLRHVGKIRDYHGPGDDVMLFQTVHS